MRNFSPYFTENSNQDEVDCLRKPGSLPDLAGPQIDHLIKVSSGLYVNTTCTLTKVTWK